MLERVLNRFFDNVVAMLERVLGRFFEDLLDRLIPPANPSFGVIIGPVAPREVPVMDVNVRLNTEQKIQLHVVEPETDAGNPAPIEGIPTWESTDPSLISLEVAGDGMSAWAITAGPIGTCDVRVSGDADLGEGVVTIQALFHMEVVSPTATSFELKADAPVLK